MRLELLQMCVEGRQVVPDTLVNLHENQYSAPQLGPNGRYEPIHLG